MEVVDSHESFVKWLKQMKRDEKLSPATRSTVEAIALCVDELTWEAVLRPKEVIQYVPQGTYYSRRQEAVESGWLRETGTALYTPSERTQKTKVYELVFKNQ